MEQLKAIAVGGLLAIAHTAAMASCVSAEPPQTAAALGFTKALILECPSTSDISPNRLGVHKLYSGEWWADKAPEASFYSMADDALVLPLGGDLLTVPRDFGPSALPLLSGRDGFYVEFEARITDNDPDHWPALWLMPAEHNRRQDDHYSGDPPGFQRWMELDVDEGNFGPGMFGTAHSWEGVWPRYAHRFSTYPKDAPPLDRTKFHAFAAAFEPRRREVSWYLDGKFQFRTGGQYVSPAATQQNFYLLMTAQSHGKNIPYELHVRSIRVFTSPAHQ